MSLEARNAERRERAKGRLKPEFIEKQNRHIDELRASGQIERAVHVGQRAPAFSLPNQHGDRVSLDRLLATGPLVVTFFRGSWCSYCVAELEALEEIMPEVRAAGGNLVAISPELQVRTAAMIDERSLSFDVLLDDGLAVTSAYGLAYDFPEYLREMYHDVFKHDIAAYNHDGAWHLSIPARFVIDTAGIVREAHIDADYRHRPEPADSLETIRRLATPARA